MIEVLVFGLSENRGGIETYLMKIWSHIDRSSFHYSFIDMTGEGGTPCFYNELVSSGCDFYKITPRSVSPFQNKRDLKRLFENNKFDILHFNVNTMSYILPVDMALKNDCKVLVHSRNAGTSNQPLTRLFHYVNKFRQRSMHISRIAVSDSAGKWLFGDSCQYEVYNNGIDVSSYSFSADSRYKLRDSMIGSEVEASSIVFGNVGAFLPAKNHAFLIEMFAQLCERFSNIYLWLIGDGPLIDDAKIRVKELRIADKVIFMGKRRDMKEIYSALDVFLFPSLYEGFPNALLEAQCAGLRCYKSNNVTEEVSLSSQVTSLPVNQGVKPWVDAIVADVANARIICSRQDGASKVIGAGLSVEAEVSKLEQLYRNICL